ncbi:hypothetical protein Scep_026661 [Stephania cephalantha]|uniref:Uncharacterized protein n=1 Tax=Stephania cephalantha TaxID=152367 RepID=A0AAP0EQW3_9MAGN
MDVDDYNDGTWPSCLCREPRFDMKELHESLAPRAADPNNDWHDYKLNHARCKVSQIQFLQDSGMNVDYRTIPQKDLAKFVLSRGGWSKLLCTGEKVRRLVDVALVFVGKEDYLVSRVEKKARRTNRFDYSMRWKFLFFELDGAWSKPTMDKIVLLLAPRLLEELVKHPQELLEGAGDGVGPMVVFSSLEAEAHSHAYRGINGS